MFFSSNRPYSLYKSRQTLKSSYKWYKKRGKQLSREQMTYFESKLQELDQAVLNKERESANCLARELETFCQQHFKKTLFDYAFELIAAIAFALVIATVVRQTWFELYEIPTGSMRPTFEEQDHLTVTKTAFGINFPLRTAHLYFDPQLVQRTSVVIWSGDGVPYLHSDSTFMGIPYTKRYIKRCMGKPGDHLYFYGGKIFGFDHEGKDLVELRNSPWLKGLEHIPYINFEGQRSYVEEPKRHFTAQAIFHQMNQAIGRLVFSPTGEIRGEVFNGKEWIKDQPAAQRVPHAAIQTYSDFWGIRNFAMARLLTKDQVQTLTSFDVNELEAGVLYLELRHTPSLSYPTPLLIQNYDIILRGYSTLIPLNEEHLKALMSHMYTARFVVKNGKATRYDNEGTHFSKSAPSFPHIPDGTYEFYYGKAMQIGWGGIAYELPPTHPLYDLSPQHVQKLFNLGIQMSTRFDPQSRTQLYFPYRFAYFRDGDLYLMGGPVIKKTDPTLINFAKHEKQREEHSSTREPYVAFKDYGPPIKEDGSLDYEFIQTFGFKVPDGHYLVLGDNHAMSQDSRSFGPIPQANLQCAPSLIIWPPGPRWGLPNQKPYPLLTLPRLIVWSIAAIILLSWYAWHRSQLKKPIFKKLREKGAT